jgi:hypothetical protein
MKAVHFLISSIVCSGLLQSSALASQLTSGSLAERALITTAQCDDAQDAIMTNPIFHASVFANTTIDKKLPDGTDFRHSTA